MKKLLLPLGMIFIVFTSCHKLKDHHNGDPQSYRISKITHDYNSEGISWKYGLFTYNSHNDPVTVEFVGPYGDYPINWLFKYDNRHRLIEYYRYSGPLDSALFRRRYKLLYDNQGQVSFDSLFFPGREYGHPEQEWLFGTSAVFTYDAQGRMTKFVRASEGDVVEQGQYLYDAEGNAPKGNGYIYDNKINPNRTHKVWQFVNRDYSKNNPFPLEYIDSATAPAVYNRVGLPTEFRFTHPHPGGGTIDVIFLDHLYNRTKFTYEKIN